VITVVAKSIAIVWLGDGERVIAKRKMGLRIVYVKGRTFDECTARVSL
jgi:hypothetical protein